MRNLVSCVENYVVWLNGVKSSAEMQKADIACMAVPVFSARRVFLSGISIAGNNRLTGSRRTANHTPRLKMAAAENAAQAEFRMLAGT